MVVGEGHIVRVAFVLDVEFPGSCPGGLQGLRDHEGDRPAVVRDPVVLEHGENRVVGLLEFGRVVVGEDGVDAGYGEGVDGPYGGDASGRDGGRDGPGVQAAAWARGRPRNGRYR